MIRKAFMMSVHPGKQAAYAHRHQPIWPELQQVLRMHGVDKYSIFLNERSGQLFAYAEIESEARWAEIAATEVCQRWWTSMKPLMPNNVDGSPVSVDLVEVFNLE